MTGRTMRVAELPGVEQPIRMATRPVPEPGPGEVRVRIEACGVCGSDVFLQEGGFGARVQWPRVPGHEAAGRVDALGEGVTSVAPGDQVALYYITTPPGDRWAAAGRPNISPHVTRMGVDVDGAFAEYVIRPEAALIRPPREVPPQVLAVLTDAVATPLHGLKRVAHLQPGETVIVLGIGGLGSNAVQLAKAMGARVIAVTRSAAKQQLARELGADVVIGASDGDPVRGRARGGRWVRRGRRGPVRGRRTRGRAGDRDGRPGRPRRAHRRRAGAVQRAGRGDLLAGAVGARVARLHPRGHRRTPSSCTSTARSTCATWWRRPDRSRRPQRRWPTCAPDACSARSWCPEPRRAAAGAVHRGGLGRHGLRRRRVQPQGAGCWRPC